MEDALDLTLEARRLVLRRTGRRRVRVCGDANVRQRQRTTSRRSRALVVERSRVSETAERRADAPAGC